ncbi:biotin/lipoyl-binding protein, partial [Myxococcota bacterium]|nr:biotin/lipoyl-binding protein [Myxococcota bacterium]
MSGTSSSKRRWIAGLVVVAALAGLAYARRGHDAPAVVRVEARPIAQTVVVTGRVMAPSEVKLGALVRGRVARVLAREGDRVDAGAILVELEDAEARAALAEAEAQLARAEASL